MIKTDIHFKKHCFNFSIKTTLILEYLYNFVREFYLLKIVCVFKNDVAIVTAVLSMIFDNCQISQARPSDGKYFLSL